VKGTPGRGLALLSLVLLAGCGVYRWGYEPEDGIATVAVPIFENKTLRRGYEYALTRYVRQDVLDKTPLQLARDGSGAATVKGTILSVTQGVVIPNQVDQDPPTESSLSITVSVVVMKGREVISGPTVLNETENWVPTFAQTADSASDRILRKLAERVVDMLEEGWGAGPSER
jgi:hypothetical protein